LRGELEKGMKLEQGEKVNPKGSGGGTQKGIKRNEPEPRSQNQRVKKARKSG